MICLLCWLGMLLWVNRCVMKLLNAELADWMKINVLHVSNLFPVAANKIQKMQNDRAFYNVIQNIVASVQKNAGSQENTQRRDKCDCVIDVCSHDAAEVNRKVLWDTAISCWVISGANYTQNGDPNKSGKLEWVRGSICWYWRWLWQSKFILCFSGRNKCHWHQIKMSHNLNKWSLFNLFWKMLMYFIFSCIKSPSVFHIYAPMTSL